MVKSSNGIIQGDGNKHSTNTRDIARRLSGSIDIASSNISGFSKATETNTLLIQEILHTD